MSFPPSRSHAASHANPSEATHRLAATLAVVVAALVSAAVIVWTLGDWRLGASVLAAAIAIGGSAIAYRLLTPVAHDAVILPDWQLVRDAADQDSQAVAITARSGQLVCANDLYARWFEGMPAPPALGFGETADARLLAAGRAAWRDGEAVVDGLSSRHGRMGVRIKRCGAAEDHLLWRFALSETRDLVAEAERMIAGPGGKRLGEAGIMAALVGREGRIRAANQVFALRAGGRIDAPVAGREFVTMLMTDREGTVRFAQEGGNSTPVRAMQVRLLSEDDNSPALVFLIDEPRLASSAATNPSEHLKTLLGMMPLGLALADRDGRFLFVNKGFASAAGLEEGAMPVYPGDLVVREDKAAVADAVRRFATGQALSGDIAVRLKHAPEEPVALTIAGARGLGDAAVLLSLKDNSEELRLKRQAEQATKMQAVGQLAGGVAHDFNNVLTAIIGHCDLMLMRHSPGDSDYDDIQQIRSNSNRAASLTRQLLAFSRQQTLRPQILQLPDVISEVSNLLKRLIGETVTLNVKHGRNLGAVRADPGQLEQVIVNLAVNARDAMQATEEGTGTLTLETFSLAATEVRQMGSEVLPVGDYTALAISDTGTGIPPDILPKIFEPFFTTKPVGKGTGLGLSTVYGIVKQTGGFIFADSRPGHGTRFTIYLPVHHAPPADATVPALPASPAKPKQRELWGSETILLVEDEDTVRAVAERALTRQGYTVLTAENGEEALAVLARNKDIDLLISDVVMPMMDGPTLVRHARERYPKLPILFMSGYAEEQLRRSIQFERVAFLPKPFSVQQLSEAARQALFAG